MSKYISRRDFLRASGAAALTAGLLSGCGSASSAASSTAASSTAASSQAASSQAAAGPSGDQTLNFGTDSEPTGFDPHTISEEASLRIMNQLYETLVERDKDMNFYGVLAESWETPDAKTYTMHLRKGVKFHSGREMTSADVKYSFDRVLGRTDAGDIGALGNKGSYYGGIDTIDVPDDYTVQFNLKAGNAAFLSNLTSLYGSIVDKDVIAANGDLMRSDGGTGPFTLGEWLPDNYVKMSKFADYWDAGKPELDGISYFLIGDEAARLAALRTGQIDIANLSATSVATAQKESTLQVLSYQTANYIAVGCNLSTEALQNKDVRQAMSYAMDRSAIINVVFGGQAEVCSMMPPAMGHWAEDVSTMDLYKTDVDKAKKLMEGAGYSDSKHLSLKVAAGLMDSIRQTAVVLQQQWAQIYIDLDITNLESGEYVDIWGKMMSQDAGFDLMVVEDGAGNDPNRAIAFFFGTDAGANVWGFSNARVDELCEQGIATTDEAEREKCYDEAQEICIDDCTKIEICSPMSYYVANKALNGFAPNAATASDFREAFLAR